MLRSTAEKDSTLVVPFPAELLRFFDHAARPESSNATVQAPALPVALTEPAHLAPADAPANGGGDATEP